MKLLLPLLNKNVKTFKGPTWYLSDSISIETISPEDLGLLKGSPYLELHDLINNKSKCVQIHDVTDTIDQSYINNQVSKISFLLNYFSQTNPVSFSFCVIIERKRKIKLIDKYDLPSIVDSRFSKKYEYKISNNIDRDAVTEFYKVVDSVCNSNKNIFLTLSRFNSALSKSETLDKIIDLTISLESLIDGTNELRNRFALYNSIVAEKDTSKRLSTYNLLLKLYDARSKIVHGSSNDPSDKNIKPAVDNWDDLIRISKNVFGYYFLYLYQNTLSDWHEHQKSLALGITARYV